MEKEKSSFILLYHNSSSFNEKKRISHIKKISPFIKTIYNFYIFSKNKNRIHKKWNTTIFSKNLKEWFLSFHTFYLKRDLYDCIKNSIHYFFLENMIKKKDSIMKNVFLSKKKKRNKKNIENPFFLEKVSSYFLYKGSLEDSIIFNDYVSTATSLVLLGSLYQKKRYILSPLLFKKLPGVVDKAVSPLFEDFEKNERIDNRLYPKERNPFLGEKIKKQVYFTSVDEEKESLWNPSNYDRSLPIPQ